MAVDAVIDSVSVATTFKETLGELGIIFCSFGEAVQKHPDLIKKYMGSVVPVADNYFAALNSAVFTDGSRFVYGSGYCYNYARKQFEVFSVEACMNRSGVSRGAAWNL